MSRHTPGPWRFGASARHVMAAPGQRIALVVDGEDAGANGRLIAAAPDLLAACGECLDFFAELEPEVFDGRDDLPEQVRAAVAKAAAVDAEGIDLADHALDWSAEEILAREG